MDIELGAAAQSNENHHDLVLSDYRDFPGFDGSLGTLTSVRYDYSVQFMAFDRIDYETQFTSSVNARFQYGMDFTAWIAGFDTFSAGCSDRLEQTAAPADFGYFHFESYPALVTGSVVLTAPEHLAPFRAPTFAASIYGGADLQENVEGPYPLSWRGEFWGIANVSIGLTYRYQPVPEPAPCAALGAVMATMLRRRRKWIVP